MNVRSALIRIAAPVLAIGCTVGAAIAPVASATDGGPTTTTVAHEVNPSKAKAACIRSTDRRLATVTRLTTRVGKATGSPEAHRTELGAQLEQVHAALETSKQAISTATSHADIAKACHEMVSSTRIGLYVFKTRAVVSESRVAKANQRAPRVDQRIERAITRAADRGVPADKIADAERAHADANAQLAAAAQHVDGVVAALLPLTPAQVNDHLAQATIKQARADLKAASENAKAIRSDLETVRRDLRKTN